MPDRNAANDGGLDLVSMNIGASDASSMISKSQMAGVTQNLRATETIKETDKTRESERARESDPEATAGDSQTVAGSAGATRTGPNRRMGPQDFQLGKLGRGQVEWSDADQESGQGWLPASLRPQSRTAGGSNEWNIPYWLISREEQPGNDSPMGAHRKLLNGLRSMVYNDIQQYIKGNDPPYAKKTLRDIYNVLGEDGATAGPKPTQEQALTGDPAGLNTVNWKRAMATFNLLENPQPELGEAFEMVA